MLGDWVQAASDQSTSPHAAVKARVTHAGRCADKIFSALQIQRRAARKFSRSPRLLQYRENRPEK